MSKKRTKKKSSMRPAAPDLMIAALADTVEVEPNGDLAALIAVAAAPAAPDTLAPVANDAGGEGRPTMPDAPSSRLRATPAIGDDVMDNAFFSSGRAVEENMREEARIVEEIERGERPKPPSKQQIARRRSFQRVVAIVVAGAAAVFFGAIGVSAARGTSAPASAHVAAQPAVVVNGAPVAMAEPAKNPVASEPAKVEAGAPPAPLAEPAAADVAAQPTPERDPEAAKALTKKALSALERGKYTDAITHGKASVDADPTDANAYLYWGTALMETGKRADAKVVFAACVESATRGPKHECRAFR